MATSTVTKVIEIDIRQAASAQAAVKQMAGNLKNLDETAQKTQKSVGGSLDFITSGLKGIATGFALGALTTGLVGAVAGIRDMIDKTQVLRSRLELVTGTTDKAAASFESIIGISVRQGQSLDAIGTLYEKIQRNANNLGVTQLGVSKLTEGFAAALRLSGSGAQQAEAAILQFSQALASGRLQGDEFRSMTENNAVFMTALAEASGKTLGELKELSTKGKIDLEFLRNALFKTGEDGENALQKLIKNAATLPFTFEQAKNGVFTQLNNLVDALFNTANKSESIFTRMARSISAAFGNAANEARMFATRTAAREASRAGTVVANIPEMSDAEKDMQAWQAKEQELRKRSVDTFATVNSTAAIDKSILGSRSGNGPLTEKSREAERNRLSSMARADVAEADAIVKEMARIRGAAEEVTKKASIADLLQTNWTGQPGKPEKAKKVPKGPGAPKIEDDTVDKFYDKIVKQAGLNEDKLAGAGKHVAEFMQALNSTKLYVSDMDKELGKYSNQVVQMAYDEAKALDDKEASAKRLDANNKEVTKLYNERVTNLESYVERTRKAVTREMTPEGRYQETRGEMYDMIHEAESLGKTDVASELTTQLGRLKDNFTELGKKGKTTAEEIQEAMVNSSKEMSDAIIDFALGGEQKFGDLIKSILKQLASAQLQKALNPLLKTVGDGLTNMITGGSSGSGTDLVGDLIRSRGLAPAANGAWTGGNGRVDFFASGGVVNGATSFQHSGGMGVMGEAGAEAIMPLQRDASGKLGVGTAPVSIEINNYSGGKVSQTESMDDNGNKRISLLIEQAVQDGIQKGRFDKAMGNSYGVRRQGK